MCGEICFRSALSLLFLIFFLCICVWICIGIIQIVVIFSNHCFHHCINCLIATKTLLENTKRKIKLRRPLNAVVVYPVTEALELPHYEGDSVIASSTIYDAEIIIE